MLTHPSQILSRVPPRMPSFSKTNKTRQDASSDDEKSSRPDASNKTYLDSNIVTPLATPPRRNSSGIDDSDRSRNDNPADICHSNDVGIEIKTTVHISPSGIGHTRFLDLIHTEP